MKTPARRHAVRRALSPRHREAGEAPPDMHHEVRHFIKLMRLMGGWPVQVADTADTQGAALAPFAYEATPWCGGRMLACYALALAQALLAAACLRSTFERLTSGQEPYIERVILVLHMMYEILPLSVPMLHWHTGRELAGYFNDWTRFQASWLAVTGDPLRFHCGRKSGPIAAFVFAFSLFSPMYHARFSPHLFAWKVPLYVFVVGQVCTQALLWRALNVEVVSTAVKMPRLFRRHLNRGQLTATAVRGYCMLWLRLRALTHALGEAWGTVMLHAFLAVLLMSMASWYGLMYALRKGAWRRVASTFVTATLTAMIVNWFCSQGSRAVFHLLNFGYLRHCNGRMVISAEKGSTDWSSLLTVSRGMLLELLTTPLGQLDAETRLEVMRFAQVLQFKPVCLRLRRLVVVNRELSVAAAATVTTYIVVLAQLALSMSVQEDQEAQSLF